MERLDEYVGKYKKGEKKIYKTLAERTAFLVGIPERMMEGKTK